MRTDSHLLDMILDRLDTAVAHGVPLCSEECDGIAQEIRFERAKYKEMYVQNEGNSKKEHTK